MKVAGVYCFLNKINFKRYIGSAVNIDRRIKYHKSLLKTNKHSNIKFQRAVNKWGIDNFEIIVLEEVYDINVLRDREQHFIDFYNSCSEGYNLAPNAKGLLGFKHSQESKNKMSETMKVIAGTKESRDRMSKALKGRIISKEWRDKLRKANLGKKLSEETKAKMSIAQKGKKMSLESIEKMRKANKGKKLSLEHIEKMRISKIGFKLSEEHKEKLRKANTGRKLSQEIRQKISLANKGKIRTQECKDKLSRIQFGKKLSPETRDKIGMSQRGMKHHNAKLMDEDVILIRLIHEISGIKSTEIRDKYFPYMSRHAISGIINNTSWKHLL
jgi:group I intron endonuclease